MNEHYEVIFHQALQSGNPQAITTIAQLFHGIGEVGRANALMRHVQKLAVPVGFGVDVPKVAMPAGYRRATAKEITKPVLKFANKALEHALPIGKLQVATVTNADKTQHVVGALTEVHYDNHPPRPKQGYKAYEGPEFLHPGISMLVPDFHSNPAIASNATPDQWAHRQINPFPTEAPGTLHSQNIYAGDNDDT
jgi:hypothetical protein